MSVTPRQELQFNELPGRSSADPLQGRDSASSVRVVRLHPGSTRHAHRHPLSEEVVYVRTGHGTVFISGVPHRVGPGDLVHIPPGSLHATIPDAGELVELICFFPHPNLSANIEETEIELTIEEHP